MTDRDVWNEKMGVTKTIRENILLYLSQKEEAKESDLRSDLRIPRKEIGLHIKYLSENDLVDEQLLASNMESQYSLTEKGDNLVAEIRWED